MRDREKKKEREKEAVPGANSTCWGDGETAVVEGGGGGTQEHTLSFTLSMHVFAKDSLSTRAPPLRPTFILL